MKKLYFISMLLYYSTKNKVDSKLTHSTFLVGVLPGEIQTKYHSMPTTKQTQKFKKKM